MIQRHLAGEVRAALRDTPVVLIQGARQTGKTTLVRSLDSGGRTYLSLDEAATLAAARSDPAGFINGLSGDTTLDEIQKAPELLAAMKLAIDRERWPGRFLLTGSASVLLVPKVSESLAGRMELLTLWPLSQGEIDGVRENFVDAMFSEAAPSGGSDAAAADITERIARGGYPEVVTSREVDRRRAWFQSYVSTIVQRDVRDLANIERLIELPRLLSLLAARAGALLNCADLSRDLALPQSTLKRYLALLRMVFLVQTLPAWSANLGFRLVKAPKIYVADTGLLCCLLGLDRAALAADSDRLGHVFENFVVVELRKQASWSRVCPELFHFRTQSGQEVDIVLESRSRQLVGIEVKASTTLKGDDTKGLRALAEAAGDRFHRGVILYRGRDVVPFGPKLHAMPASFLWRGLTT